MKRIGRTVHETSQTLAETLDSLAWPVRGTLRAASYGYSAAVRLRGAVYSHTSSAHRRVDAHVISVGNIVVGGTGKTPVTEYIARRHVAAGRRVAILSRGYGRPQPVRDVVVVSSPDGGLLLDDWRRTGDEPQLLARNVPHAAVLVCADRVRAARMAVSEYHTEVIILDDGFQHMRLARDENVVVLDATQPLDTLHLLPRGTLREPPSSLRRATMAVLTHADRCSDLGAAVDGVHRYAPDVPVVCTRHRPVGVRRFPDGEIETDLTLFTGRRVAAVSAIGNPAGFERSVAETGMEIAETIRFPDHHVYTPSDIDRIGRAVEQHDARAAVTTEKDAVRLPEDGIPFPLFVLTVEIDLLDGFEWPAETVCSEVTDQ